MEGCKANMNKGSVVSASRTFGTLAGPVSIRGMPSVVSNAGAASYRASAFGTFACNSGIPGMPAVINAGTTHTMVSQAKFCTFPGSSGTTGETSVESKNDYNEGPSFELKIGNVVKFQQRISTELEHTERKVRDFRSRYDKLVRPLLVSKCLVHQYGLNHPSTAFLHRQTYDKLQHNANYVGCFDIMAHEAGCNDFEWKLFLDHLDKRRIYIIEDWDFTVSTIQTLMYDHGLKEPLDGTGVPFLKGECDGTYDPVTKTASLSYIIWKGDQILCSEVYKDVPCSSTTEAEVFAAMALLHKAIDLKILKLLLCSDNKTVINILSGELEIGRHHEHRDFYLMLRSMKAKFDKLIPMWKPRELMAIADDLAKLTVDLELPSYPKLAQQQWEHHLKGRPLFRIRRTKDANTIVKNFDDIELDDSYGKNGNFVFFVEVKEDQKFDCLVGLKQSLNPSELKVFINDIHLKSDSFLNEFGEVVELFPEVNMVTVAVIQAPLERLLPTISWWLSMIAQYQKKYTTKRAH
ncbi:hypothetical protein ACQJBY_037383 [Aegilops geniculata]